MNQWPYKVQTLTRQEIDEAIKDELWQETRLSMKGVSTPTKLRILENWRQANSCDDVLSRAASIQIDNYINALRRGGQLNDKLEVVR